MSIGVGFVNQPAVWRNIAILAAVYFGSAKLGIELSVAHGVITPVWAPTGISLAALVLFGYRLWPGVALGAFLANFTSDVSVLTAGGIAVGNTLEAVVGVYLLRRVGFRPTLERARDVLALIGLAAPISTMVSATIGTSTLWLADAVSSSDYGSEWTLWWFGDLIGDLLVAPLLLVWFSRPPRVDRVHPIEASVLAALLAATSWVVFFGGRWKYPYILFPLLIWAALRFKQRGATAATLLVAVIAVWGTVDGSHPIGGATPTESVQILQALIGVVAVSLLVMAAVLCEREMAEDELKKAHENLSDAQKIARLGSWEWDIESDTVRWSDELFRIYGLDPADFGANYEAFLTHVHPEDREKVASHIREANKTGASFTFDHRIVRLDGSERILRARGDVVTDHHARPVRMAGTAQDITEQVQADEQERRLAEARSRQQQALELNDDVVQGLVAAKLALESSDLSTAQTALDSTLHAARSMVSQLLSEADAERPLGPGDFVRSKPAVIEPDPSRP